MTSIGDNLRRLRNASGLSQGSLAALSGVSQQLISQIERGENETTKELPALALALGCRIGDLDESYAEPATNHSGRIAELASMLEAAPPEVLDKIISYADFELSRAGIRREKTTSPLA